MSVAPETQSQTRMGGAPPILRAIDITKRFGHVQALHNVCIDLWPGEIVGLVGDNGAGKSTFVKCLAGVYQPDGGTIEIDQRPVTLGSPMAARQEGIETVYQDLSLATELTVANNVFLGREIYRKGILGRLGFLDYHQMRGRAAEYIREIGIDLPTVDVSTEMLSGGQRQGVAIARARAWASRVLLLDEPTAALGVRQTEIVLEMIRRGARQGMAILIISHDLPSLFKIADQVLVLRLGEMVASLPAASITYEDVVSAMLGKEITV